MRISDLYDGLAAKLQDEFERLSMKYKGFPFHISVKREGNHREWIAVAWSLDKHGDQEVSRLSGKIMGPWEDRFFFEVQARRHKELYPGEEPKKIWGGENWYEAGWRQEPFLVELSAKALWPLLECHADMDKVVKDVLTT